jgi:hypothetical protein
MLQGGFVIIQSTLSEKLKKSFPSLISHHSAFGKYSKKFPSPLHGSKILPVGLKYSTIIFAKGFGVITTSLRWLPCFKFFISLIKTAHNYSSGKSGESSSGSSSVLCSLTSSARDIVR